MPDPGGTVGEAGSTVEQATPEYIALHVLEGRLHVAFIAILANEGGHGRCSGVGGLQFGNGSACGVPTAVSGLEHVENDDAVVSDRLSG